LQGILGILLLLFIFPIYIIGQEAIRIGEKNIVEQQTEPAPS
jgi:hypothetical protein